MLEVAQRSSLPFILANAYGHAAAYNLVTGNGAAAQRHAEESMAQAQEMGIVSFLALATADMVPALIAQGRLRGGHRGHARRHLRHSRYRGYAARIVLVLSCLWSWKDRTAHSKDLKWLEEGFASVAKTGEQNASPSLYHVKGELLVAQNPPDRANAELCFRRAIEIARRQSARIDGVARHDESRPAAARYQGRRDEARAMLAEIYGWFTEGFDTADLKDAKALLDELNE